MSESPTASLTALLTQDLPFLRRYARALTGDQAQGDAYVAAAVEAATADAALLAARDDRRLGLFRLFHRIWSSAGGATAEGGSGETALSPGLRPALLLNALEGFEPTAVALIMGVDIGEAEELLAAGRRMLEDQAPGRVLIIEDEPIIAMDLEGIVGELGHGVVGLAATCDEAVAMAAAGAPDLVLADIQLADGSSGIDAARLILAEGDVPVIFVTAYPERLLTGERPEPAFLIAKPFKEAEVGVAISQALFLHRTASRPAG